MYEIVTPKQLKKQSDFMWQSKSLFDPQDLHELPQGD